MAALFTAGLIKEAGLLIEKIRLLVNMLKDRITDESLQRYADRTEALKQQSSGTIQTHTQKEQFTDDEESLRKELNDLLRKIQNGVKKAFPAGSPQLKDFHVGDHHGYVSATMAKWGDDVIAGWNKHKQLLVPKSGILQADIDELADLVARLRATDKQQELARTGDAPASTKAEKALQKEVAAMADEFYAAVALAFRKDPDTVKAFEEIRQFRYQSGNGGNNKGGGGQQQPPPSSPEPPKQ